MVQRCQTEDMSVVYVGGDDLFSWGLAGITLGDLYQSFVKTLQVAPVRE